MWAFSSAFARPECRWEILQVVFPASWRMDQDDDDDDDDDDATCSRILFCTVCTRAELFKNIDMESSQIWPHKWFWRHLLWCSSKICQTVFILQVLLHVTHKKSIGTAGLAGQNMTQ